MIKNKHRVQELLQLPSHCSTPNQTAPNHNSNRKFVYSEHYTYMC